MNLQIAETQPFLSKDVVALWLRIANPYTHYRRITNPPQRNWNIFHIYRFQHYIHLH